MPDHMSKLGIGSVAGLCSAAGALVAVGIWAGAYGATVSHHDNQLRWHGVRLNNHRELLEEVRGDIREMKADLKYLRDMYSQPVDPSWRGDPQ